MIRTTRNLQGGIPAGTHGSLGKVYARVNTNTLLREPWCTVTVTSDGIGVWLLTPAPFRLSRPKQRELKRIGGSQSDRADDVRRARVILGLAGGQTLATVSRSQACTFSSTPLFDLRLD